MRFDLLSLFPDALQTWLQFSILKRAQEKGLVEVRLTDIRDFTTDRYRSVDDQPFGGGVGMLMKLEPLTAAIEHCLQSPPGEERKRARVILVSPDGKRLDQALLEDLAGEDHIIIVCGRYEGTDERLRQLMVTDEISLGDFVITGGELAAAVLVDGVTRLLPGVLGKDESSQDESFTSGLLEYPQYTRPPEFRGLRAPAILLGGNHAEIEKWRRRQALLRTAGRRPDLLPANWRTLLSPPLKKRRRR